MSTTRPRKDHEYLSWSQNIETQCTSHEDWGIPADSLSTLSTLNSNADTAYKINLNRETANHHTAVSKQVNFRALKSFMGDFVLSLRANSNVPDGELVSMDIPSREHHAHAPLPVPPEPPTIQVVTGFHGEITVYVEIPQEGHPSTYMSRKGYHGFKVAYLVEGETIWRDSQTTRLHLTLPFDSEDVGKKVTIKAAWTNPRLQHGPWSDEHHVLVN
jgi:hypothetical protein